MKKIILGLLSIFLISPLFASGFSEKQYNQERERQVPDNPPDAIGNPATDMDRYKR